MDDTRQEQEKMHQGFKRLLSALRRELQPALDAVLNNDDGWARLKAISDEEWQEVQDVEA